MTTPSTAAAARLHIEEIRKSKGLGTSNACISDLESALDILSNQLYQSSTHFLLELIQNADDNHYEVPNPSLTMTYKHGRLRIDCNEAGFTMQNVEAICKIGQSTKSASRKKTSIGEKGIGFKSVFKVADHVWIASGPYTFKFDKKAALGMVAPEWASFPEPRIEGHTSMLLNLSKEYDPRHLMDEISELDPRLLIFLRKLKEIKFVIYESNGAVQETVMTKELESSSTTTAEIGRSQIVQLSQNGVGLKFHIIRYVVDHLRVDPKRSVSKTSEIALAFPIQASGEPLIKPQHVYAFLPVRDYGFKFLIHADFILVASREDIDYSSVWNEAILDHLPSAFLGAVNKFNAGDLRYMWIRYLRGRPSMNDFFESLDEGILKQISTAKVLESISGQLERPAALKIVPPLFADDDGTPLILTDRTKAIYLSAKYLPQDRKLLGRLGVGPLTPEDFLNDLRNFTVATPDAFQQMPDLWHSRLSRALKRLLESNRNLETRIRALSLIRLQDNQWVSLNRANVHIPDAQDALSAPNGIGVYQVHETVVEDDFRRELVMLLGAKTFRPSQICNLIELSHRTRHLRSDPENLDDLISHMEYLLQFQWKNTNRYDLYVMTESGTCCPSSQVYIDAEGPFTATSLFADRREAFHFLHPKYKQRLELLSDTWAEWLQENLRLDQSPRLVFASKPSVFGLSRDFRYLLGHWPSSLVLSLLKLNWKNYSRYIQASHSFTAVQEEMEMSKTSLREKLSQMEVLCRGGLTMPLFQTVLPQCEIDLEDFSSMTILDIPDPEDPQWMFLEHFGVIIESGVPAMLQYLRRLKIHETTVEQVNSLYTRLDTFMALERDQIRNALETENLVYIPATQSKKLPEWTSLKLCVWDGPKSLRSTPCLRDFYPEQSGFFCTGLGLGNADLATFMAEAARFQPWDNLEYISQIFTSISSCLEKIRHILSPREVVEAITALMDCRVFPVRKGEDGVYDELCSANSEEIWFIADLWHLQESFKGRLPLLALDVPTIERLEALVRDTPLASRLLSRRALGTPKVEGKQEIHHAYTESLRKKARFIARLVPKLNMNRELLTQLQRIEVHRADAVVVQWNIEYHSSDGNKIAQGRAESGRVSLVPDNDTLKIYLQENDIKSICPPLELQQAMAKLCGISILSHITILNWILMERDISLIEAGMRRHGFSTDVPVYASTKAPGENGHEWPEQETSSDRVHYGMRNPNNQMYGNPGDVSEAVTAFAARFNAAQSWNDVMSQPWGKSDVENMLSFVCEYEHQPANLFLPQAEDSLGQAIMQNGGSLNDFVGVFFQDKVSHTKMTQNARERTFPAVVKMIGKRRVEVVVSKSLASMISKFLEGCMGDTYRPAIHWTSSLRSKAGLPPLEHTNSNSSTFSINDKSGDFTRFLASNGFKPAGSWRQYPFYHIEVVTTEDDILSPFSLDPQQVDKARTCLVSRASIFSRQSPSEVYVLARVANIRSNPSVTLLVNPWQMHLDGLLSLTSEAYYSGSLNQPPPILHWPDFTTNGPNNPGSGTVNKRLSTGRVQHMHKRSISKGTIGPYRPLQNLREIRLFELSPGSEAAGLHGVMHHKCLSETGPFCALSYTWSLGFKTSTLETPDGDMKITASLESALKRIRREDIPRMIWVDAICIDQDNAHEKTGQIRLMKSIFESAETVLAWLGQDQDESYRAIQTLLQIRTLALSPDRWPDELPAIPVSWKDGYPLGEDDIWDDIGQLFRRRWFKRVWIIQEVVVAADIMVICGQWELSWDDFFQAVEGCLHWAKSRQERNPKLSSMLFHAQAIHALGLTRRKFHGPNFQRANSLIALLDRFAYTESTQDRDKLFALLGLAGDADDSVFDPDYLSPSETVLRRYANEFINRKYIVQLLYTAGLAKGSKFSSWIPDWTSSKPRGTISTWRGAEGMFCAGGNEAPWAITASNESKVLQITGCFFDRITFLSGASTEVSDVLSVISEMRQVLNGIKKYPTGEKNVEIALKLPIGNAVNPFSSDLSALNQLLTHPDHAKPSFDFSKDFEIINSVADMTDFLKKPREDRERNWDYWRTAAEFMRRIGNGRFCSTAKGYVGFVPHEAQLGDEIFLVRGAAVPFVVRKAAHSSNHLTQLRSLVGESYIHGIMYGEALPSKRNTDECISLV